MSYIQQFAEMYPNIYSLIVRYINGAHNQEKALMSLSPEADCRHMYWIIDFTWFVLLMFPRYRSLYRHPDRLP